jgi:hypothetical protein
MVLPELKEAICPFIRTILTASDAPQWSPETQQMNVEDLVKFVQDQPGSGSLGKVLRFFAVFNHGLGNRLDRIRNLAIGSGGRFSTEFVGSDGDHAGGSLIYNKMTGEFDQEQFGIFTSFSQDGETMTVDDLGRAIVDANKRHNGSPTNALQSAGEFGLLAALLGDVKGTIKISDMEQLFERNEFSSGACANLGTRTAEQWFDFTLKTTAAISEAAIRIGHNKEEMKVESLTEELKTLFSPLLRHLR